MTLVIGFVWPLLGFGPDAAEKADATAFLEATRDMESAIAKRRRRQGEEMAEVRQRFQLAREKAEQAQQSQGASAFWLKLSGGVVSLVGAAGYYASRPA